MPTLASSTFNEVTENWLLLNVVWYLLLSLATLFVMWYYSEKNLPWHIRISVFVALGASLSIVIMVPWDVSHVYQKRCQNVSYTEFKDNMEPSPSCPAESSTMTKVRHRPSLFAPIPHVSKFSNHWIRSQSSSKYLGTSCSTSPTCRGGFCCRCSRRTTTRGSSRAGASSAKRSKKTSR